MAEAEIAICAVYNADEAIRSEHARERGIVRYTEHPTEGPIPHLFDPLARAGLSDPQRKPSPSLGEHTEEILKELEADRGTQSP